LGRCQDPAGRARVHHRYPELTAARALYSAIDSFERWHLEARLLAGEDRLRIAAQYGPTPEVVGCNHDLFFDVQERLQARDFLYNTVISPKARDGLRESDVEVFLKLFALVGGPLAVDALVDYFQAPPPVSPQLDDLEGAALQKLQKQLRIKVAIQARVLAASEIRADQVLLVKSLLDHSNADAWPSLSMQASDELSLLSPGAAQEGVTLEGHTDKGAPNDSGPERDCSPYGVAHSQHPAA
jgi:hypothetical protein